LQLVSVAVSLNRSGYTTSIGFLYRRLQSEPGNVSIRTASSRTAETSSE